MGDRPILHVETLGFPWVTSDPFLFCVHHLDKYPQGNEEMGPAASLKGRRIGMDFAGKDGWNMYHGDVVPGFPQHPHRGFETITIARRGYIDHSDSLGATARFGEGDVQWMTAGGGVVHSEMFPLLSRDEPNTTELFQIWLNLPSTDKHVEPYFTMLWSDTIPSKIFQDDAGRETKVTIVAGQLEDLVAPKPPPNSWASREEHGVAVWTIKMQPDAKWRLPAATAGLNRMLYFFDGNTLHTEGRTFNPGVGLRLRPNAGLELTNGDTTTELLLLQGRPINEPVVQHGPFVMNSPEEIRQTFMDFQRTGFGGWPWPNDAPVHPRDKGRFAIHADGRQETPS